MEVSTGNPAKSGSGRKSMTVEQGKMRKIFISVLLGLALAATSGCVYQANLAQGNLLKQEDLDQVEVGMTRTQVRFLLGTPMIDDPFHLDRWDYIYFIRIGRNPASFKRWVSIFFDEEIVREIVDGQELSPDL
jgi:outer membrane protein assembly factor BamE